MAVTAVATAKIGTIAVLIGLGTDMELHRHRARVALRERLGISPGDELTPEQEHKKRIDMMFAEQTLREVEAAGAERRPEGVSHVLESDERQTAAASAHSADRGEVGGPRGAAPTRFGDWERGGRASDF